MNKVALRYDEPQRADWNMALDEWLWTNHRPTLRFYGWEPAALSLGYFQPHGEANLKLLDERGFSLVRRLTGGKAVLHRHEVTYSLIAPAEWFPGPLVNSYDAIGRALQKGLSKLGVRSELVERKPQKLDGGNCFQVPSWFEVVAQDKKLIGSAQKRRRGWLMQHGSLLISQDNDLIRDLFGHDSDEQLNSITLAEILKTVPDQKRIAEALAEGFADQFGWEFKNQPLTKEEKTSVKGLAERYRSDDWNLLR